MPPSCRHLDLAVLALLLSIAEVYAASRGEYRGFYVTAFSPGAKTPDEVDRLVAEITAAHGNLLVVQVGRRGDAYYNYAYQPRTEDPGLPEGFDALKYLLDKAHAAPRRIEVHAWLSTCAVWNTALGSAPLSPEHVFNRHGPRHSGRENWFTRRVDGEYLAGTDYYLDPGHPDAADYIVRMYAHLAAYYELDGIHLDRVRYPEMSRPGSTLPEWGYNATSIERFNRKHDRTGIPDPGDADWVRWRMEALRSLVRKIYLVCTAINPGIRVSASTVAFGAGPQNLEAYRQTRTYSQVLQDPVGWLAEGILDIDMPLNYDRENNAQQKTWFEDWIRFEKENARGRHVVPATALYLNSLSDSLVQFRKILAPSENGRAAGVMGFSCQAPSLDGKTFAALSGSLARPGGIDPRGSLFSSPVETPQMPWKDSPQTGSLIGWLDGEGRSTDTVEVDIQGPEGRRIHSDGNGFFGTAGLVPGEYRIRVRALELEGRIRVSRGSVATLSVKSGPIRDHGVYRSRAAGADGFPGSAVSNRTGLAGGLGFLGLGGYLLVSCRDPDCPSVHPGLAGPAAAESQLAEYVRARLDRRAVRHPLHGDHAQRSLSSVPLQPVP